MHVVVAALAKLEGQGLLHECLETVWLQHGIRLEYLLNLVKQVLTAFNTGTLPPGRVLSQLHGLLLPITHFFLIA